MKILTSLLMASACAAAFNSATAFAQAPAAQQADDTAQASTAANDTAEIVVTANRREESLSDVPVSISAFSQASLDQKGVRNISDLSRISPGITFSPAANGATQISIRGISSSVGAGTTGVYIDDTPIQVRALGQGASATNAYPAVFDVERVEVLRGPQGTLFGAGSEGGTVRFITPQPGLSKYSGYVRGELGFTEGGDPSYEAGAAIGGPIVEDKIGFRISAFHRKDGGWIDRVDPVTGAKLDPNSDGVNTIVLRGALTFALGDLKITPSIYFQRVHRDNISLTWRNLSDPEHGVFRSGNDILESGTDKYLLYSLATQYDFGSVTLYSNTSYFDRKNPAVADYTAVVSELLGLDYLSAHLVNAPMKNTFSNSGQKVFTQEVRLQSNGSNRLNWVLGAFYQDAKQSVDQSVSSPNMNAVTQTYFGGTVEDVFGIPLLQPGDLLYFARDKSRDKQIAAFGQVDFKPIDRLTLTAGFRLAKVKFRSENLQDGPFNGSLTSGSASQSERPFTPKIGVNFKPTDELMIYASAAKGFRIGGGNAPVPATQCADDLGAFGLTEAPQSYKSDSVWSYEAGTKGDYGRKLRFDASAFYIKWNNIQSTLSLANCGFAFVSNLGTATSKGFDVHVSTSPFTGLTLDAAVTYTHARYDKTVLGAPIAGSNAPGILISKGDPLRVAPWTVNLAADYETPVSIGTNSEAYLHADYNYASGYDTGKELSIGFDPLNRRQDSIHQLNLRTGLRSGGVDLSFFVNNVTNARNRLFISHNTLSSGLFQESISRPRTIGATVSYRY